MFVSPSTASQPSAACNPQSNVTGPAMTAGSPLNVPSREQGMKRILIAAAIAGAAALPAQSATTSNNFNVSTSLSSQCQATNSGSQTVDFGTYTAFQATPQAGTSVNLLF